MKEEFRFKVEEKPFTKADLKDGDILTLRNGKTGYYTYNMFIDGLEIDDIRDDLSNNGFRGDILDIVKVERPTKIITVYERTETKVKEMTVEEISKALGYEVKIVKGDK